MPTINGGGHFLFTEADTFNSRLKSICGGGQTTASKNPLFSKAVILEQPPPKNSFPEAGAL
jgi:hypothetical protein